MQEVVTYLESFPGGHILSLSLIHRGLLCGMLFPQFSSVLFSPWVIKYLINVLNLQVFFLGCGSYPLLWDICTDHKSEKFNSPQIVSPCFYSGMLVSCCPPKLSTIGRCFHSDFMLVYIKRGWSDPTLLEIVVHIYCWTYYSWVNVQALLPEWSYLLWFFVFLIFLFVLWTDLYHICFRA